MTSAKSEIGYLNDTIEHAVTGECENGPPQKILDTMKVDRARVYGFAVPGTVARDKAVTELKAARRKVINAYRDDAAVLREHLDANKIVPLAIITKKAWYELATRAGLCILAPDTNGRVCLKSDLATRMRNNSSDAWAAWLGIAIGAIFTGVVFHYFISNFNWTDEGKVAGSIVVLVLASVFAAIACTSWKAQLDRRRFDRKAADYEASHTWREFLTEAHPVDAYGTAVHLELTPEPPERTLQLLHTIERAQIKDSYAWTCKGSISGIKIAADYDALSIRGGMRSYFGATYEQITERERIERLARWSSDPIIFVEKGSAVAILDQFGDFPIERKVIEDVANSEHLL